METATVFRFQYGLKKTFLLEASMTQAKASFFAMGIGFERRLAVQERNESEMVDVRCTMPMLLQLRCGDKVQIKANQRSYGFLFLWSREEPADIALNVAIRFIRSCCPPALADELKWLLWLVYRNS